MTAANGTPPAGTDTLDQARDWLRANVDEGAHCPLCTQHAKVYRRGLEKCREVLNRKGTP